jgi:four helix bundle protein
MKDFTELQVWQEAHKLTLMVYAETDKWPASERFRLVDQACRSSSSVGSQIAEGWGRFNDKEFHHFCNIARGSLAETRNHLMVARDRRYTTPEDWAVLDDQCLVVTRLLQGLMKRLRSD